MSDDMQVKVAKIEATLDYHLKECSENWLRVEKFMGKTVLTVITAAGAIIASLGSLLTYLILHIH